jgi:predicted peptidase
VEIIDNTMSQQPQSFQATIQKNVTLEYLLYLPPGYQSSGQKWPLVLFLHGIGERGADLELLKLHGIPKVIADGMDFPFLMISPQCPEDTVWSNELDALHALLENIIETYQVDKSRIYLTGLSMGGFGTWHLAATYPSMFAAIVPICGGTTPFVGFPEKIKILKNVPVWTFHGAEDEVVPLQGSQELVDMLIAHQGDVKFTIYPDTDHDSWTQTYENPELYKWLLQQKNDNFQISGTLLKITR